MKKNQVYKWNETIEFSGIKLFRSTSGKLNQLVNSIDQNKERTTTIRRIKACLSWSRTWAKFRQLITSLSVSMSFFFALKVRLKDLKFEFCKLKLK